VICHVTSTDQEGSSKESDTPLHDQSTDSEGNDSSGQATPSKAVMLDNSLYMRNIMSNMKVRSCREKHFVHYIWEGSPRTPSDVSCP